MHPTSTRLERDQALDLVKGFLVALMVVYHSMNYFAHVPAEYYGYLRFVNGAFVFLSGWVVATLRSARTFAGGVGDPWPLLARGGRLFGLFTALNLAIGVLGVTNYRQVSFDVAGFAANAAQTYLRGDSSQMAFRILLPIAYLLMLSAAYVAAQRLRGPLLLATLATAGLYPLAFPMVPNAFFLLTGLAGLCAGMILRRPPAWRIVRWPVIAVGCVALASQMNLLSGNPLAYAAGVGLLLSLLHRAGRLALAAGWGGEWLMLAGRYSLAAYIVQIGYLFALQRLLRSSSLDPLALTSIAALSAWAVVWATSRGLDRVRLRSPTLDKAYRMVFN